MTVDFDALRGRLRASVERRETAEIAAEAQLRERAKKLAAHTLRKAVREVVAEVIVVRRERSMLALPILCVEEVREVRVTRLPHRSRFVCGLFSLRGRVCSLVDVQPLVGAADEVGHGDRALVALVRGPRGTLGLRVDEVLGPRVVYGDELDTSHRDRQLDIVARVTRDCVEIVDMDALFASETVRLEARRDR